MKYKEYKQLNLPEIGVSLLERWKTHDIFQKSINSRPESNPFNFYEGPPSANGLPGIHHVMARAIKDIFCRYKTLKGFRVNRKGGWDTHGLPIELAVEKALGITKEDIGTKISVDDYNKACKTEVMKYTDVWNDLTEKMGYWVDLENPYITYKNEYIESLWSILKNFYDKGLLYKGYTIQPYSPAAGTGLSSHELNQPGTYKMVKDTTVVAQFKVIRNQFSELLFQHTNSDVYILAWTTTPWTLPSNTALAVGKKINYFVVNTFNAYTFLPVTVVIAADRMNTYFPEKNADLLIESYQPGDKQIPFVVLHSVLGSELEGISYEQLMPFENNTKSQIDGDAFKILTADFVTTEDGTGIVHLAPSFGSDDFRVAKQHSIGSLTLVDKQGKFIEGSNEFTGMYVKNYKNDDESDPAYRSTDVLISIKLKEENKAFKVEKYEHSYPHCWRTDKPILYYPLDSWFIKTTAVKERMVALNKTINWKPESTGTGRFGNWLENLVDWNLSRSRYWGTPLPIWRTLDGNEEICIGAINQLIENIEKGLAEDFYDDSEILNAEKILLALRSGNLDLHRPYVDDIVLVSDSGEKMFREADLIDVWFDSGAMPYAQWHYPFENQETFKQNFPADFIAEGVDQTRGWFFTLHAISTMLLDSVAYKNVISNGLVLDKNGNKMSKRLGNAVDPFATIGKYGADATRWYMIANASPWDNLKFNEDGIVEAQRKFFGTLHNVYSFFALYANIDSFKFNQQAVAISERPEIDRWVLSMLNSLIKEVDEAYSDYEPTKAARAIQYFADEHLSNWYVRLCRRRFWKGEFTSDKIAAYQTLYECLETIARLMSPIAPFYSDRLFLDLDSVTGLNGSESVHLTDFPIYYPEATNDLLENRMLLAQQISSMVLSLRKKSELRVRQPLQKILIPIIDERFKTNVESVRDLILSETNVKEIEYISGNESIIKKQIKANFKTLGPKVGNRMKEIAALVTELTQKDIATLEQKGQMNLVLKESNYTLEIDDVEIRPEDIEGWLVASSGILSVALDITLTKELKEEGIARELINRIQNLRKEKGYEVTDKIILIIENNNYINEAVKNNLEYICAEILALSLKIENLEMSLSDEIEIDDVKILVNISK